MLLQTGTTRILAPRGGKRRRAERQGPGRGGPEVMEEQQPSDRNEPEHRNRAPPGGLGTGTRTTLPATRPVSGGRWHCKPPPPRLPGLHSPFYTFPMNLRLSSSLCCSNIIPNSQMGKLRQSTQGRVPDSRAVKCRAGFDPRESDPGPHILNLGGCSKETNPACGDVAPMTGVWEILFPRHLLSPSRCHGALWVFKSAAKS